MNFFSRDWKYKAEGNKHVVVSDGKGKCLRLIKASQTLTGTGSKCEDSTTTVERKDKVISNEKSDEIKFIEHVVMPLVRNCDAFHVPQFEKLPVNFLQELDQLIKSHRPHHRKHQSLNVFAPGLVMQDYCFISETSYLKSLLKAGFTLKKDAFSIEIKLKNGFLKGYSNADSKTVTCSNCVCQFCKTQMYRVLHEKRYKLCSLYCPLDLFSGDETRMKQALHSLLLVPQNNFRLFKNGELLYSQEVLDAYLKNNCSEPTELRTSPLQFDNTCLKNFFSKLLIFEESDGINSDALVNLLLKSLLTPVLPPTGTELPNAEFCQGVYFKEKFSQTSFSLNKQCINNFSSEKIVLPSNCILGIILSQQQMDTFTLSDIHSKCKILDLFIRSHPYLKDELEVDSSYDSIGWKNFLSDPVNLNSSTL